MKYRSTLVHEFVEYIPDDLKDGTIYVSITFATAIHKCCCGCGNEVVTPISPTDWQLTFDGESISLYPSIGSWNLDCKSHYWITNNKVKWAWSWSKKDIEAGRTHDRLAKERYFNSTTHQAINDTITNVEKVEDKPKESLWRKLTKMLF
jgi:hypothetical protein